MSNDTLPDRQVSETTPGTQNLLFGGACDVEASELTFEAARRRALSLQTEFAASRKSDGVKAALARYLNPQVSHWANAFDNKLLGKVAYTVGTGADGTTHVATKTMGDWAGKFQEDHSCACQGGRLPHEGSGCAGRVTISVTKFREHFYRLPGVTERTMNMQPVLGRGGRQRWNDGWTKITLNMGAVVREKPILTGKRGRPELAQWTEPWDITSTSDYYTEKLESDVAEGLIRDPMTTQRGPNADNLLPSVPRSIRSASSRTHEGAPPVKNEPGREEGAPVELQNTFIVWQAKSGQRKGEWLDFSLANCPRRAPGDARTVTLAPEEAVYLRQSWPMEKGLSPADRAARAEARARFLLASGDAQAAQMAESMRTQIAAEQQHQAEAERAVAERRRVANEIESWLPRFESAGMTERHFHGQIRHWRDEKGLSDEKILVRLPQWLERATARHAEKVAAEAERAEEDRAHAEYAAKTQDSGRRDTPSGDTPSEPVLSEEARRADRQSAIARASRDIYRDVLRERLALLGVPAEMIEHRITNEWAGLESYVIDRNLKHWSQAVQSANAVHEN